jgi:hypothetical protein
MIVARFTCEILGAIPVGELEVRARVIRPGRSVDLVEAVASAGARDVASARAWRVLRTESQSVGSGGTQPPEWPDDAVAGPAGDAAAGPPGGWVDGYLSAVEWRPVKGSFGSPGPATVWARLRYPLVLDEDTGPLERVLAVADSGNGLSSELDITRWQFINPELTVHLHRMAVGEWVCLDAATAISAGGAGLATSALYDLDGPLGVGAQSLLVTPRRG